MQKRLQRSRRIVVKLGSHVLAGSQGGFDQKCVAGLVAEMARAREQRREFVIVSSGAVLAGRAKLGVVGPAASKLDVTTKQALAAVGQVELMRFWQGLFDRHGATVAQVLLTRDDVSAHDRFINARGTLDALLKHGVIPIVNENDTIASEEIRLGDNDNLSAIVTGLVGADLLVLLTDKDGVYTRDPEVDPSAELVRLVNVEEDEEAFDAGGSRSRAGLGGMNTKVAAARIAAHFGVPPVSASAKRPGVLGQILAGAEVGTLFLPKATPLKGRRRWLFFQDTPRGRISVDDGAARAIVSRGKSLLPSGITRVHGEFGQGDAIEITDARGRRLARGLVVYTAAEIRAIAGRKSSEIEGVLGYNLGDEVVHRDDLVLEKDEG